MALFGLNYNKPGPGISKDEPQKTALFRFFGIFTAKFWDLLKINMIYFVSIFIFFIPVVYVGLAYVYDKNLTSYMRNPMFYLIILASCLPIICTGPFTAGFTYVMRNFVRREHVFLWSDFKDIAKANIKQSILATLVNVVIYILIGTNICFYFFNMKSNEMMSIPFVFFILALFIFFSMNFYVYTMIVTFDLKLRQIYKNALIFSTAGILRNILISVIIALIVALNVYIPALLFLIPFFTLSLIGLIMNFGSWPMIQRYMIDSVKNNDSSELQTETIFQDVGREKKKKS